MATNLKKIKVGIVGTGAIGGVIAVGLASNGYDVETTFRQKNDVVIDDSVLIDIVGEFGELSHLVKFVPNASKFTSKKDIIFITTKAYNIEECLKEIKNSVNEDTIVVYPSNVFISDKIEKSIKLKNIIGMFIEWTSEKESSTKMRVTKSGEITIGGFGETSKNAINMVAQALNCITDVKIANNMKEFIISRLIVNYTIFALGEISGIRLEKILKNKAGKKLFKELICEGVKAFKAKGFEVRPYENKLDYNNFIDNSASGKKYVNKIIDVIAKNNAECMSSALIDLQNGKQTESKFLIGKIVEFAKENNVDTPYCNKVYGIIKQIENGTHCIYERNLDEAIQL